MLYRTILCASDGLPHSKRALRRAAALAREARAELHVVHVPEAEPDVAMLRASDYAEAMRAERERAIRVQIEELADEEPPLTVVPHFVRTHPHHEGSAADRIAALAERIDADLIVVGSRRRSRLGAAVAGSTSQRLMRETRRPVLVLAGDAPGHRRAGQAGRRPTFTVTRGAAA